MTERGEFPRKNEDYSQDNGVNDGYNGKLNLNRVVTIDSKVISKIIYKGYRIRHYITRGETIGDLRILTSNLHWVDGFDLWSGISTGKINNLLTDLDLIGIQTHQESLGVSDNYYMILREYGFIFRKKCFGVGTTRAELEEKIITMYKDGSLKSDIGFTDRKINSLLKYLGIQI